MELNNNGKKSDMKNIKKKKKINMAVFSGIILVIIGGIMAVSGFMMGADLNAYSQNSYNVIETTSVSLQSADVNETAILLPQSAYSNLELSEFKDIDIKLNSANVSFIQSESYGIDMSYYEHYVEGRHVNSEYSIGYEINNGVLRIFDNYQQFFNREEMDFESYDENVYKPSQVRIYMPSNVNLNSVNIDIGGNGNLDVSNINALYLNVEKNSIIGDFRFSDSTVKNVDIKLCNGYELNDFDNKYIVRNIQTDDFNWKNDSYASECIFDNINTDLNSESLKSKYIKINAIGSLNIHDVYADRFELDALGSDKIRMQNVNLLESYSVDINVDSADVDIKDVSSQNVTYNGSCNNSKFDSIKANSFYANISDGDFKIFHSDINNIDYINKTEEGDRGNSEWNDITSNFVSIDTDMDTRISSSLINKLDIYNECAKLVFSDVSITDGLNIKGEDLEANLNGSFFGNTYIDLLSGDVDFNTSMSKSEYEYSLSCSLENSLKVNGEEVNTNNKADSDVEYRQAISAISNSQSKANNLKVNVGSGDIKVKFGDFGN